MKFRGVWVKVWPRKTSTCGSNAESAENKETFHLGFLDTASRMTVLLWRSVGWRHDIGGLGGDRQPWVIVSERRWEIGNDPPYTRVPPCWCLWFLFLIFLFHIFTVTRPTDSGCKFGILTCWRCNYYRWTVCIDGFGDEVAFSPNSVDIRQFVSLVWLAEGATEERSFLQWPIAFWERVKVWRVEVWGDLRERLFGEFSLNSKILH